MSAIHAISLAPVPRSGAGTFRAGLKKPDQLCRVTSCDALQRLFVVLARVNHDSAFGPAKRYVDDRAFVAHQRGERLNLILVNDRRVANPTLRRQSMVGMRGTPPDEDFVLPLTRMGKRT